MMYKFTVAGAVEGETTEILVSPLSLFSMIRFLTLLGEIVLYEAIEV
jgi:hypothetical protein